MCPRRSPAWTTWRPRRCARRRTTSLELLATTVVPADGRVQVPGRGPRIVLAVEGTTMVTTPAGQAALVRGQALFVGADERVLAVEGDGVVVQADVP